MDYYKDVSFPPVNPRNESLASEYQNRPIFIQLQFEDIGQNGQVHFTLNLVDAGYDPGLDIRCH